MRDYKSARAFFSSVKMGWLACEICDQAISRNSNFAPAAHLRTHVKKGELVQNKLSSEFADVRHEAERA